MLRRLGNQDRQQTRARTIERRSVSGEEECGGQSPHSGSENERQKRAALPPQRGKGDLRLTLRGKTSRLSGEGEAQNRNSK